MKLEIGTKLLVVGYGRDGITTDTIKRKNKTTYATYKKQTIHSRGKDLFFYRERYCREYMKCDVTGKVFTPAKVEIFNQKEYDDLKVQIEKREEERKIRHRKWQELEDAKKPFNEYKDALEDEVNKKLNKAYIEHMCGTCRHFENLECNDIPEHGKLNETQNLLWRSSCRWKKKEE